MTQTLIHGALGLGVVLVVPLALRLDRRRPPFTGLFALALAAGSCAGLSFLLSDGILPAASAAPWLAFALFLALRHVFPIDVPELLRAATEVLPFAYLVTGAAWLVISRHGARPLGFSDTIVELTAVHFHYAGFVAPVLLLRLVDRMQTDGRSGRLARLSLGAVLAATPLTAAGITFEPALGAAGAVLFASGLTVSAVLTLRWVVPTTDSPGKVLLTTSSLSVIVSLGLAVAYALGQWLGTAAPSLPMMVRTHGVLNAVGFGLAGVLGWLREENPGVRGAGP